DNGYAFFISGVSGTTFNLRLDLNSTNNVSTVKTSADHAWTFLAATWDGTTIKYYTGTEGSAVTQLGADVPRSLTMAPSGTSFTVGNYPNLNLAPNGWLDDSRLYNEALDLDALEQIRMSNLGLPGDYNQNGVVDAADYVMWRKAPGSYG